MFDIIKSVISAGNYRLAEIQYKINKMYILGDLTETQMNELHTLAGTCAASENERPQLLEMLRHLSSRVDDLTARIAFLENKPDDSDTGSTGYPKWNHWDGLSDLYQYGAIVSHNDQLWQSVYAGQNVWEPGTVGNQFWIVYEG